MSHWTMMAKKNSAGPYEMDASPLAPKHWKTLDEALQTIICVDGNDAQVSEVFDVQHAESDQPLLTIHPGDLRLHRVGGAAPDRRLGLRGGTIHVCGSVGDLVGHRMRRGIIVIDGDVGGHCGATMIAGTIVVSGHIGSDAMDAARRGTLITSSKPTLPADRYSRGVTTECLFAALLARDIPDGPCRELAIRLASSGAMVSRGDASVGGQCEILRPT